MLNSAFQSLWKEVGHLIPISGMLMFVTAGVFFLSEPVLLISGQKFVKLQIY